MLSINGKRLFTSQQAVFLLFAVVLCDKIIIEFLSTFLGGYGRWGFYIAEGVLLILAAPALLRSIQKWDIFGFLIWAGVLLSNVLLLRKEQGVYFVQLVDVFLKCFPIYFVGKAAANYTEGGITRVLQWVTVLSGIGYAAILLQHGLDYGGKSYSQYTGYILLPPACIALCLSLKGKLIQIPFAILLGYGVLASGARGPLFSLLLGVVVYVLGRMNRLTAKKMVGFAVIGLVVCLIAVNMEAILTALLEVLSESGLSVRVIRTLLDGSFMALSGRNILYDISWKGAFEHPFGVGIFHDRQFLLQQTGDAEASSAGYYAHNLFLEIPLQFGIILGGILVVLLIILLLKAYRNSRRNDDAMLCIAALFGTGLFPLMVSASYVEWAPFYLMMGYVVTMAQKRKPDSLREIEDDTKSHS